MPKVEKSDLSNGTISSINSRLSNDIADTDSLIASLSSFINDTNTELQGKSYDAIREKVSKYIEILNIRKKIASNLQDAIPTSVEKMSTYLDIYSSLDTDELTSITNSISNIQSNINTITSNYNNGEYNTEDGTTLSSLIGNSSTELTNLQNKKDKIEQLSSSDSSFYSPINEIEQEINDYKTLISEITESNFS